MQKYFDKLQRAALQLDSDAAQQFCDMVYDAYRQGNQIFICGNGGSASLASHMAIDMMKLCKDRVRVVSLADNSAIITAIANDFSYDLIFSSQLAEMCEAGDLLIAISGSGASMNVILAAKMCKERGGLTVALTGNAGNAKKRPLHTLADHAVIVNADHYGIVEDIHCSLMHVMCDNLRERQV